MADEVTPADTTTAPALDQIKSYDDFKAAKKAKPVEKTPAKAAEVVKTEAKVDGPAAEVVKPESVTPDVDDVEDENGLTPRQKRELTAKMLKAIGAKHKAAMRAHAEAEESNRLAESQFNERKLLEARLERAEARLKEIEKAPAAEDQEPKREAFDSDAKYWDAKIDWKAAQAVKKDRAARAEEQRVAAQEALDAARATRNIEFAKTVPDWEEARTALSEAYPNAPPGHIQAYIMESELSAPMMHYFGTHLEEYGKILELSPVKAIAAIGKLEAKLDKVPEPKPTGTIPISRAPAPIGSISESVTVTPPKDPSKMTFDELRAHRRAERAAAARH
jgi:hypothetical protein